EAGAWAEAERSEAVQRAGARETEARSAVAERTRIERELGGRVQAAEARAADAAGRLAAAERARKEIEARALAEREELVGKQRAELERRDAAKSQEVARLQQSVQERARALKVAELELARLKARAAPGPASPTGTNQVVQRPAPAAPAKPAAPPTDGDEAWQKLVDERDKPRGRGGLPALTRCKRPRPASQRAPESPNEVSENSSRLAASPRDRAAALSLAQIFRVARANATRESPCPAEAFLHATL